MRKGTWVAVLGFSLVLGLGISLALNGSRGFRLPGKGLASEAQPVFVATVIPTTALTAVVTTLPVGNPDPVDPPGEGLQLAPTLTAIEPVRARPEDREKVLLLYDGSHPTSFAANFCKIAEFYGLLCKRADLNTTGLDEALLRDSQGAYFRLIGLDATALLNRQGLHGETGIRLLKAAVESGGANLLVSKVNLDANLDATALNTLTDGAILGVFRLLEGHYDWDVSTDAPEVTGVFSGQTITSTATTTQSGAALLLVNTITAAPLISARNGGGATLPVFVRWKKGAGAIYVDAGQLAPSLDQVQLRDLYYNPAGFTRIVPLMMTMKAAMGEEAWHTNQHYANLTIDDPVLKEPFNKLSYFELLKEMESHDFHTTIATIPAKWQETQSTVASLFQNFTERFSLVQHGNNHDGYEFYLYSVTGADIIQGEKHPARPLSEQEWDIQEGLARMELFKNQMGLSFDQVMIFPYGISPEQTLELLKKNNYLASVNAQDIPLNSAQPEDWDYGMHPAIMNYENFPLLTRRPPGSYLPFKPDIQPFLFDLFLDKPALFYSHAYGDELFARGITAFNPVADQINQLTGGVDWQSMGTILKHLSLQKNNPDGSIDIRMYGNDLILVNESEEEKIYHIAKEETLNVPISDLTVNGSSFPYHISNGYLEFDLQIPPNSTIEIVIRYRSE